MSKVIRSIDPMNDAIALLRRCDIQPTPQRLAVVKAVIRNGAHPSADDLLDAVKKECPTISRATVYNTLNLLAKKGLLKTPVLREGTIVFDPNVTQHHHFIDEDSGQIYDIPWEALQVAGKDSLDGFEIHEYQVVMRGRRRKSR